MERKELAEKYYSLLVTFTDYVEHGFKKNHDIPDMTHIEEVYKKNTAKDQVLDNKKDPLKNEINKTSSADKTVPAPGIIIKPKLKDDGGGANKLMSLNEKISLCTMCSMHANVKKVHGIGSQNAVILVVAGPLSQDEESIAAPLTLESAEYLKKWLNSINIDLKDIYITNILKCPPAKREIKKENIEACVSYIKNQADLIEPSLIVTLGQIPLSAFKKRFTDLSRAHGEAFVYEGYPVMPLYHPKDVLIDQSLKKAVWDDLKKIKTMLDKAVRPAGL